MRWVAGKTLVVGIALAFAARAAAGAQGITRDNYKDYLPPQPRIVAQARATAALRLYGDERDPAYRDADPVDGVDDERARRLLALGELFSPLLRRNNFSVPRDLDAVLGPRHTLHVDSWIGNRRVASDSIVLGGTPLDSGDPPQATVVAEHLVRWGGRRSVQPSTLLAVQPARIRAARRIH
ncbi:MAG: hypothetical protein ABR499_06095 [Gemmatimonadaceae bacterium]